MHTPPTGVSDWQLKKLWVSSIVPLFDFLQLTYYALLPILVILLTFDFLLKPPQAATGIFYHFYHFYSITHDKLQLAIWDTSLLEFLAQIWTQGTLRHILGPIVVIFGICQFLTIPGPFEYFSENGWSQKIKVFSMKERSFGPLSV